MDFEVAWPLGLSLACAASVAAFLAGWRTVTFPPGRRRLLLALAAFLAFGTAFPVVLTGLFFFTFGASGYCEDWGGPCAPASWVPLGLSLFGVAALLLFLTAISVKEYRRVR
jgi:hypothetical protein